MPHVSVRIDGSTTVNIVSKGTLDVGACHFDRYPEAYFISSFQNLKGTMPPLTINLRGVVHKITNSSTSMKGNEIVGFHLQDDNTDTVKVMACGVWADSADIKMGNELLIFFAKMRQDQAKTFPGQGSVQSGEATIWIYDDAYLHVLRKNVAVKPTKTLIQLG